MQSKCSVMQSACSVILSACSVMQSACSVILSACSVMQSACSVILSTCSVMQSACKEMHLNNTHLCTLFIPDYLTNMTFKIFEIRSSSIIRIA